MSPWLQSSSARDWANYDWVFGHFTIDTLIIQETQQETGRKCQVVLRCGQDGKVGKVVSVENWIAPRERKRRSEGDGRDDEINEQRKKRSTLEIEGRKTVECRLSAQEKFNSNRFSGPTWTSPSTTTRDVSKWPKLLSFLVISIYFNFRKWRN